MSDTVVRVEARTTAGRAACPERGYWSGRIHASYLRCPRDLPTAGKLVVVSLRVRRFVCAEDSCTRKTFAEQVPGLTRRFGRQTERLRSTLVSVGLALAGRAGARMTDAFQVPVSRNTLLRLIASLPDPVTTTPRVVGVDEYAQRKGRIKAVRPGSTTTRPTSTSAGRKAAPTPGNYGRRSSNKAIHADTPAPVTTSAGLFAASPNRSAPDRHRPAPSRAGSSRTPTLYPKATGSTSKPPWPTAPN